FVARDLRGLVKINPIVDWTEDDVAGYIRDHDVPVNPLVAQGYRSIGCWPCTVPTSEDEHPRAGRWAGSDKLECGLHLQRDARTHSELPMTTTTTSLPYELSHLDALEAEAVFIMREVAAELEHPVLLFSGGKDSIVLLRLAEKAFRPGKFPFPIMHVDTGHNF